MKSNRRISVLIPAAGSSLRFQESLGKKKSKLFAEFSGKPLIRHTLEALDSCEQISEFVISLRPADKAGFKKFILKALKLKHPVRLVSGGKTRAESVWNGLKSVSSKSEFICVHDGARPLVKGAWISQMLRQLGAYDGVVLGRACVPTMKRVRENGSGEIEETLRRNSLFEAETPQLFKKESLKEAYLLLKDRAFQMTDDASIVEAAGGNVKTFCITEPNLKVTTYSDLVLAQNYIDQGSEYLFGIGYDRHVLARGRRFVLGGLNIPAEKGPVGHSDGDALLHAITDGIFGALGAGDIGDFFSDHDKRWKNKKSGHFVEKAVALAAEKGFTPYQIDMNVIVDRPKLGPWKKKISEKIAKQLDLKKEHVNLKAKTSEGLGAEANGNGISAQALVVLKRV